MRLIVWLKKVLRIGNGAAQVARVINTGKCDLCNAPVSKDIVTEDSVTIVCTNTSCGWKYEITGLEELVD